MENEELLRLYNETKEEKYLTQLLDKNYGLITSYLKRNFPSKCFDDDYLSEGMLGLLTAAAKYDPAKQTKFSTYAIIWINQKIRRYYINDRIIRVPEYLANELGTIEVNGDSHYINNVIDNKESVFFEREALQTVYKELRKINPMGAKVFIEVNVKGKSVNRVAQESKMSALVCNSLNNRALEHMREKLRELGYKF